MRFLVFLLLSVPCWAVNTYYTTFPATANPISEGAVWINGAVTAGGSFHNVRSTTHAAFGTQPGGQGNCSGVGQAACGDSTAVLTGTWGATQTAQAIVYVIGTPADFSEVELRLRTTITSGSITGYEFNCSVVPGDQYMQIIRWNGPLGDFTLLDARTSGCVQGDVIKATASGSTLTVFKNGTSVFSVTDATYTNGSPGIGMFATNTTGQANYGFSYFAATDDSTTQIAKSCSSTDVQTAFTAATSSGATVVIPPGTCSWATQVTWTAPTNSEVFGAGGLTTLGGGDLTVIQDNYAGGNNQLLKITTNSSASATFRMAGITFQGGSAGTGNDKFDGIVAIQGNSANIRVDHSHFNATTYSPAINSSLLQFQGCVSGVVDHSLFDSPTGSVNNGVRAYNSGTCNSDALGVGDQSWTQPTGLGTSNFVFVEDSTFNSGAGNDCTDGGRWVWRHNAMTMTTPPPSVQTHPTAGSRLRGCRAWEVYSNTLTAAPSNYIAAGFWISSGTGVIWGNTIPSSSTGGGTGYANLVTGHVMRYDNSTYPETATPNGWGYCGTHFNGTGSNWDQNADASTGYACLDQIGRGQGQLIVLDFPNTKNNVTNTIAWPNQALEPVYEWADAYSPVPSNPSHIWSQSEPAAAINRDYYLGTTDAGAPITFTGATGVGSGAFSSLPGTCTAGVAYWASDISHLLKCVSTNVWSDYYVPFTYPHPLTGNASTPNVLTTNAGSITGTTASAGGNVTADGGGTVTGRGTCYATSSAPTSPCTSDSTGTGTFASSLTGLSAGTTYHYRAFSTSSAGTSYGAEFTFATSGATPIPAVPLTRNVLMRF